MAGGTTITLVNSVNDRGIYDTYTSSLTPTINNSIDIAFLIGTSAADDWDAIYEIDLTGIPKGIVITTAILALNVSVAASGTAAELALEIVRLPFGLPYDVEAMTYNNYDGVNPWPAEQFDRGIIIVEAMPTGTGTWSIELKSLIDDSIRLGESSLYFAIRRIQRGTTHKSITVDSGKSANRPTLTITHSPALAPETVIVGNRLSVINPIKSLPRQHWSGKWGTFSFGWNTTNTSDNRLGYNVGLGSFVGPPYGNTMERPGSIIGLSINCDINAIDTSGMTFLGARVYKNSTRYNEGTLEVAISDLTTGNGKKGFATFAPKVHTFIAGDSLGGVRHRDGGTCTTDDFIIAITVEWD